MDFGTLTINATASATWLAEVSESLAPPGRDISMAASAGAFPLTSIRAGTSERNPEGEEFGVVDVEDCLSFLIQATNVR